MTESLSRRQALTGAAVVGVSLPVLAACSGDDTQAKDTTGSPSPSDSAGTSGGGGSHALVATADVEVGGAAFLDSPSVVVTQPTAGDFHAFDRACTHQGCPVQDLVDGNIHCACHNSLFSPVDGSPVGGPAPSPLKPFAITVKDGEILPA